MHFSFANVFMLTGICGVIHEYFVDSLWNGRIVLLQLTLSVFECVYWQRCLQCSFMLDSGVVLCKLIT